MLQFSPLNPSKLRRNGISNAWYHLRYLLPTDMASSSSGKRASRRTRSNYSSSLRRDTTEEKDEKIVPNLTNLTLLSTIKSVEFLSMMTIFLDFDPIATSELTNRQHPLRLQPPHYYLSVKTKLARLRQILFIVMGVDTDSFMVMVVETVLLKCMEKKMRDRESGRDE
ncbi:hypothetical protein F2Q69_00019273 [Brassica cretica]|uniref:Uncharacterized protein n=1 Tax=Brassica cretica TaxID=69181 RepID=A0A8S9Q8C2_BRACR|nr:hypothetical protein F2Q69_00019273 [Brassica cretica]